MPVPAIATLDTEGVWEGTVSLSPKVGLYRTNVQIEAYAIAPGQPAAVLNSVGAWFWY